MASLVSIVVPAYNAESFLLETLQSISAQSYEHWELIIVEDASHDDTEQIVNEFREQVGDKRVLFHRHRQNQGPAAARNTAISLAEGEYIAFIDADDIWLSDHLERSLETQWAIGNGVTYSSVCMFESDTGLLVGVWGPNKYELDNFPETLYGRSFVTPSSVVLHRSVIDLVGIFDTDRDLIGVEDIDLWLRCVEANVTFELVRGCHCLYRKGHDNAQTTRLDVNTIKHGKVLERHYGMQSIGKDKKDYYLSVHHFATAELNYPYSPLIASKYYFKAWKLRPNQIRLLRFAVSSYVTGGVRAATRLVSFRPRPSAGAA